MDGFEVVQRLREDPATQAMPVILLTANAPDQRLKIQGLNLGADEYLTQPVNNSELLARIRVLLRTKQTQDDLVAVNTQLRTLLDVIQAGTSTLDLATVGRRLVEGAVRVGNVEAGGIWLLEQDRLTSLAEMGYPPDQAADRQSFQMAPEKALARVISEQRAHH